MTTTKFSISERRAGTITPEAFIAKLTKSGEDNRALQYASDQLVLEGKESDQVSSFIHDRATYDEEGREQMMWALVNRKRAIIMFSYTRNDGIEGVRVHVLR